MKTRNTTPMKTIPEPLFTIPLSHEQVGDLARIPAHKNVLQVKLVIRLSDVLVHPSRTPRALIYPL